MQGMHEMTGGNEERQQENDQKDHEDMQVQVMAMHDMQGQNSNEEQDAIDEDHKGMQGASVQGMHEMTMEGMQSASVQGMRNDNEEQDVVDEEEQDAESQGPGRSRRQTVSCHSFMNSCGPIS